MNYFMIAGLRLRVDFGSLQAHKELNSFKVPAFSQPDIDITFMPMDKNPIEMTPPLLISAESLGIMDSAEAYTVFYRFPKLIYGYKLFKKESCAHIYYDASKAPCIDTFNIALSKDASPIPDPYEEFLYSLRDAFFFHALRLGRLPIHSSSIIYRDRVWLFSAPSGTGKSTHARLWQEAGIEHRDFNGDVCMIYRDSRKKLTAGALPWCGTSNICTSSDLALGGIFFLTRSSDNSVSDLCGSERILKILSESLAPNWDRSLVSRILDICEDLEKDLLLAALSCNMSVEAALCSKDYIDNKMIH